MAAAPAVVWALVCDIQLPARFSAEFEGAEWLDGARARLTAAMASREPADGPAAPGAPF